MHTSMSPNLTSTELTDMFNATDELTASSPSGRHYGLYKAVTNCPQIMSLLHVLVSTPFKHGFILHRWRYTTQIMIKKKEQPWSDRLRIIELFEADYNTAIKIYMRRLMWYQINNGIIQDGTYGSIPGGTTYDALFTRQLIFDIHLQMKQPLILIDNDAKACYDRMIATLATHLLSLHGLPQSISDSIHQQLVHRDSNILTGLGLSDNSNTSSPHLPLYGIGQGSGAGPAAWHAHLLTMIATMSSFHQGYTTTDPTSTISYNQIMVTFVDDTSFLINDDKNQVDKLIKKAEDMINSWLTILRITGGDLALDKTTWSMLHFNSMSPKKMTSFSPPQHKTSTSILTSGTRMYQQYR